RLLFDAMFPARGLADVGVNYFGKSKDWAQSVLRDNTMMSDEEIRTSLLKDGSDWPVQILPYSLWPERFREEREKVRQALGKKFDIRRFHNVVLPAVGLPMDVLDTHLQWFVAQEKTGADSGICPAPRLPSR